MIRILCNLIKTLLVFLLLIQTVRFGLALKGKGPIPVDVLFGGLIGIVFLGILMIVWANSLSATKCPKCSSREIELDSVKEIDRWIGKTKVREKLASGKIKERYLQCTKVKKRYTYECKKCNHQFSEVCEQEL